MHDSLGNRMKEQYESRAQTYLPRRTYTIIRLDGKAFHSFTHGFDRPYDTDLMYCMGYTAQVLCEEIQGARLAYVQSDEISVLLTDFEKITTSAWFDGNIQKIVSVSASIATAAFNYAIDRRYLDYVDGGKDRSKFMSKSGNRKSNALFDSRCFVISDPIEVRNYLVWRQQDATRNAINMVGQSMYSHKQLHGKNVNEVQEMIFRKGKNFNDYPDGFKRGRVILQTNTYMDSVLVKSGWAPHNPPIFTQDKDFLKGLVPIHPDFEEKKDERF
jgi:tRNA(His) 5'-end guanylyltransferase